MSRKRVAVIFGGASPEHEVSLNSSFAVLKNFPTGKFDAVPIGIARDGSWFHYRGPLERIKDGSWPDDIRCYPLVVKPGTPGAFCESRDGALYPVQVDIALPMLHGPNGEDGSVQGLLQLLGIPLVGCGTASSAICMDKFRAHALVSQSGIESPRNLLIRKGDWEKDKAAAVKTLGGFSYPFFVKPLRGGSSIGITKVWDLSELTEAIERALSYDSVALIEESVPGFEVGCAVIGIPGSANPVLVSRVDEVENPTGFLDYQKKYGESDMRMHLPARIDDEAEQYIREMALHIYDALDCSGFARVDMFYTSEGQVVFNEVNTIPGFTESSRFPAMAETLGLGFGELIEELLSAASQGEV